MPRELHPSVPQAAGSNCGHELILTGSGRALPSDGGPLANPGEIAIAGRGFIVLNAVGARSKTYAGPGVQPLVRFDMTVGKGEHAEVTMQGRRVMDKLVRDHIHAKARGANARRIGVDEDEAVSGLVGGDDRRTS